MTIYTMKYKTTLLFSMEIKISDRSSGGKQNDVNFSNDVKNNNSLSNDKRKQLQIVAGRKNRRRVVIRHSWY